MLERFGWRLPVILGCVGFLLIPFLINTSKHIDKIESVTPQAEALPKRFDSLRFQLPFWAAYFFTMLLIYGLATWLPEWMLRSGNSMYTSLTFPIILNLGAILGTVLFAIVAERVKSTKRLLAFSYIAGGVGICAFATPFHQGVLFAMIMIVGACIYGVQNLLHVYVSGHYPPHTRSSGLGWCFGWGRLGAIAGAAMWGILLGSSLLMWEIILIFSIPAFLAATIFFLQQKDGS
jgi:AAHS family benzoate transporter-like MFS transporter